MRLALTAGGTGGHIYPALSVLEAIRERQGAALDVAFFGPDDRGERNSLEGHGIHFERVPSAPMRGRGAVGLAKSSWRLEKGIAAAIQALRRFKPDAVFSTGGYGSFPCSVAAKILRKPLVVFLPDVSPGLAVRAETRMASVMATTSEAALKYLPANKTKVTGYPVRHAFFETTREQAREALGIPKDAKVLLVAGASQGSHAINEALFRAVRSLTERIWVFHITGAADYDDAAGYKSAIGDNLDDFYHPAPFREDLPDLMLAADLAIMRAGASVLGELPAAALPSILVPGTFAGAHQRENARWLASSGAAVVVEETELKDLTDRVLRLIDDEDRLAAMSKAAAALARPNAANDIAAIIEEVARR